MIFHLTEDLGVATVRKILLRLVPAEMKTRHALFFRLLLIFLFAFAVSYSLFDTVREADFLSGHKYEPRDMDGLYTEKGNSLDSVLVSLFSFFPLPFSKFLPCFFSPQTVFITTLSTLRC